MDTNRCGNCGFLNFAAASNCKRCKATLDAPVGDVESQFFGGYAAGWQPGYQTAPDYPQPAYTSPYFNTPVAPLPRTSKNGGANAVLLSLLGVAVVIALGIGVFWKFSKPASANLGWQEYKSQDGSFTVEMPTKPMERVNSQMTPAGEFETHLMLGNMRSQGVYVVAYTDYPEDTTDISFDSAAEKAANNAGATLLSKKSTTFEGHPGMEVELLVSPERVPGGGRGVCRINWVAPRLYVMFVGGPESSEVYQTRAKFLDSFKLRK
jgi:hypothetical protein